MQEDDPTNSLTNSKLTQDNLQTSVQDDGTTTSPIQLKNNLQKSMEVPDGASMCMIIFPCFMIQFLCAGMIFNFGTLFIHFVKEFDVPNCDIASIGSLASGFFTILGPVYGGLLNKFSFHHVATCGFLISVAGILLSVVTPCITVLKVTFILAGIGFGSAFAASFSFITQYACKRRGIAMGIATIGSSIGIMAFAPVTNFLFQLYGLSGAMLILAGVYLNGIVFSAIMGLSISKLEFRAQSKSPCKLRGISRKNSVTSSEKNSTQNSAEIGNEKRNVRKTCQEKLPSTWTNFFNCLKIRDFVTEFLTFLISVKNGLHFRLLKFTPFLFSCFGFAFHAMAFYIAITFIPDNAVSKGIDANKAVLLLSIYAIANIPGKLILGYIADTNTLNVIFQFSICVCVSSIAILVMPLLFNYVALVCATVVFGFFSACIGTQFPLMLVEVLGAENFNSGYGIAGMFTGTAATIGPPFAGFIYDVTKSYNYPFFTAGGICALSVSTFIFIPYLLKRRKTENRNTSNDTEFA